METVPDGMSLCFLRDPDYLVCERAYRNNSGKYHREDGPAIEYSDGSTCWYFNGYRHREDGPAVEYASGYKAWWVQGNRHHEDGPARIWAGDYPFTPTKTSRASTSTAWTQPPEWWLCGKELNENTFLMLTKSSKADLLLLLGQGYDEYIEQKLRNRT